ncbi:hypothetical protein GYH30_049958 [Glycine max]|uniref:Uncharacterized protein n=1 Tax=Glycine max TaxID=3847 RepID=K7MS21_SOYBN|nr:hypothetical protein GYH30_049958 [Glycine max]
MLVSFTKLSYHRCYLFYEIAKIQHNFSSRQTISIDNSKRASLYLKQPASPTLSWNSILFKA